MQINENNKITCDDKKICESLDFKKLVMCKQKKMSFHLSKIFVFLTYGQKNSSSL